MRITRKSFNINGILVEAVSIKELAEMVGKSRNTILRYERVGIFPAAPIRFKGVRYYPISLANSLIELVQKIPGHKKPEQSLIVEINRVFNIERNKLCQK